MDSASASNDDLWPGQGVLSCAAAILFAGYVASVLLPTAVHVAQGAPASETGTVKR